MYIYSLKSEHVYSLSKTPCLELTRIRGAIVHAGPEQTFSQLTKNLCQNHLETGQTDSDRVLVRCCFYKTRLRVSLTQERVRTPRDTESGSNPVQGCVECIPSIITLNVEVKPIGLCNFGRCCTRPNFSEYRRLWEKNKTW